MYRLRIVLTLALMLSSMLAASAQQTGPTTRQVTKKGTTAATFLSIPVGARATAMGNAISASVDDGTSVYWNPAGLARVTYVGLTAEYADWLAGVRFNFASITLPAAGGTFAFGVTALRTPEMDVTTVLNQEGTGETFDAASYAFALSYGRFLTDRFSIGASVKLVTERIWHSTANGVALDIGTQFVTPFYGIRLGASISNFGTKMKMEGDDLLVRKDIAPNMHGNNESVTAMLTTDPFDMPLTMRIGIAGELWQSERARVSWSVDALHPNDNAEYVNVGTEIGLLGDMVLLRGGWNELFLKDSARSMTLGAGLQYRFGSTYFVVDYAYEPNRYFNNVHRFTLSIRL